MAGLPLNCRADGMSFDFNMAGLPLNCQSNVMVLYNMAGLPLNCKVDGVVFAFSMCGLTPQLYRIPNEFELDFQHGGLTPQLKNLVTHCVLLNDHGV